jgi:hypothetical protein
MDSELLQVRLALVITLKEDRLSSALCYSSQQQDISIQ